MKNIHHAPAIFLSVTFTFVSDAPAAETLWNKQLDAGMCDSSIAYADVDPQAGKELVLTTTSGAVVVWNTKGQPLYERQLGGVFSISPTVADVFPGGPQEILVVNQAGLITCLAGRKIAWQYQLPAQMGWNDTTILAEDLDLDGTLDVLVGDKVGHFFCLSPEGVERWKYTVPGGFHCPPAVADLIAEPGMEVVFSTGTGKLVCLSAQGQPLWQADLGCDNTSGPVVADLDGDRHLEIVIGGKDNRLHCFAADGKPRWAFDATAEIDSAISCGDIDGDGKREIVFVDLGGKCFCVDADGKKLWQYDVGNRCRRSPSLADFDGDDEIEVLVAGYDNRIYLLSHDGREKDIVGVPNSTNGGPTVVDSGKRLAVVVPYGNGTVGCYTWLGKNAPSDSRVLWAAYRVTPGQRGSVIDATRDKLRPHPSRISYDAMLVGRNVFEVRITNPNRQNLSIELGIKKSPTDEVLTHAVESKEISFVASLPYLVRGDLPETLVFSYVVRSAGAKQPILAGRKAIYVEPFVNDIDAVRRRLEALGRLEAKLRQVHHRNTEAFTRQRLWFEHRLADLAENVAHPSRLTGAERAVYANDLKSLASQTTAPASLARVVLDRLNAGKQVTFAVWPANPWSPLRPICDRASRAAADPAPKDTTVTLYRNEKASLAVDVLNLLDVPLDLRLRFPNRFKDSRSPSLAVGQVIAVPTETKTFSADAISPLNRARIVHLAPGEVRQLWITIDAADSAPGTFTAQLNLSALTADTAAEDLSIAAKVVDLDITAAPAPKFCNWAYLHSSCVKDYEDEARGDLIDHGTNVFVVTAHHVPRVTYDESGKLTTRPDFAKHDAFLLSHGKEAMFLFSSPQGYLVGPKGHGFGSEAYRNAYKTWVPQWVAHLKEIGIGYDRFAFYPVDEPGLNPGLVERYIEVAKLTRQADPNVLMYTDPVGRATTEEIERMAPFVDIWCPHRLDFLLGPDDPRIAVMHRTGKHIWSYECDHNAKSQSPLGYYRGFAWLAERNNMTGIGFWSYCTSQHDPWCVPAGGHDYLLIYPGAGVISSKRWEACRDGLEDLRAAWQLKALTAEARRQNPNDPRAVQAEKVLADAVAELSDFNRADTVFAPAAVGPARASQLRAALDTFDAQHDAYRRHRQQIAEVTLALKK